MRDKDYRAKEPEIFYLLFMSQTPVSRARCPMRMTGAQLAEPAWLPFQVSTGRKLESRMGYSLQALPCVWKLYILSRDLPTRANAQPHTPPFQVSHQCTAGPAGVSLIFITLSRMPESSILGKKRFILACSVEVTVPEQVRAGVERELELERQRLNKRTERVCWAGPE